MISEFPPDLQSIDHTCDRCGLPVPPDNSAAVFDRLESCGLAILCITTRDRHILPISDDDGKVVCLGSPSRAQYFPGQPVDARAAYARPDSRFLYENAVARRMLAAQPAPALAVSPAATT